jgi:hypothetical protein
MKIVKLEMTAGTYHDEDAQAFILKMRDDQGTFHPLTVRCRVNVPDIEKLVMDLRSMAQHIEDVANME